MLEIILIVILSRRLAAKAAEKGRSKAWAGLLVLFWITGEVLGFVIGDLLMLGMGAYLVALAGAALGATAAWVIVSSLGVEEMFPTMDDGLRDGGNFDMDNPYSPPNTYEPGPR